MVKKRNRRPWWRNLLEVAVMAAIILGIRAYTHRGIASGMAPEIEGRLLDGTTVSLSSMRGEPVILHFWASWCAVCRREESTIDALSREYPVVTVATRSGDAAQVRKHLESRRVSFPVIVDPTGKLAARYGVRALPSTFIIGPEGRIRFAETGYTTEIGLRVRRWLAK